MKEHSILDLRNFGNLPNLGSIIVIAFFVFSMVQSLDFVERVTRRCKGEASFALEGCACTVRNRLRRGWSKKTVLRAFYAPDVSASSSEIELVRRVLDGPIPEPGSILVRCDDRLYFMFGYGDVIHLGLLETPPIEKVVSGKEQIWFYEYDYRKRKK